MPDADVIDAPIVLVPDAELIDVAMPDALPPDATDAAPTSCIPTDCGGRQCGAFGPCTWAAACSNSGTRSRTCQTPICSGGTCQPGTPQSEDDTAGCARDTSGNACGTPDCSACSACTVSAGQCSGTCTVTCTGHVCSSGTCSGTGATAMQMQSCIAFDGSSCGPDQCGAFGTCSYQDTCSNTGSRTRTCTPQVCSNGACGAGSPPTMDVDTSGCDRFTDGVVCGSGTCMSGVCQDYTWALWPMPDSATPYCTDGSQSVACPSPSADGQDGNITNINTPSYSATTDTVVDLVTHLAWERTVEPNGFDWAGAKSYCAGLTKGGVTAGSWRLPTRIELVSIVDYGRRSPAIDTTYFSPEKEIFWSSSPYAGVPADAWVVNFDDGETNGYGASNTYRVRCVR